jgi:hypothetical protein
LFLALPEQALFAHDPLLSPEGIFVASPSADRKAFADDPSGFPVNGPGRAWKEGREYGELGDGERRGREVSRETPGLNTERPIVTVTEIRSYLIVGR